ncbi:MULTISPECIES: hypothetical protein [unclassified Bradyrhizobium]|uniref:hypothetical protein n=1 Tax=unclassified Bradyrhizobium TaxID=2631580 RepID=UPI0028EC7245|nr:MULTISPECIES: hypothetical protein [unclassified Bradyrhizobium]
MRLSPTLLYWYFGCLIIAASAWITHGVTTIKDGRTLLLLVGTIAWPVGVIHGWGIWLGFWP